jgi:hypothetical protein
MIANRKLKDYQKELVVIDRGIASFEEFFQLSLATQRRLLG